jgi:hypothetical protein
VSANRRTGMPGDVVDFWIESELTDSHLQIIRT